jgi:acyl dehydratase
LTGAAGIAADELHLDIGQTFVSHGFVVGQDRIDAFARVAEDEQFIHVDPEQASLTLFGGHDRARVSDAFAALADGR